MMKPHRRTFKEAQIMRLVEPYMRGKVKLFKELYAPSSATIYSCGKPYLWTGTGIIMFRESFLQQTNIGSSFIEWSTIQDDHTHVLPKMLTRLFKNTRDKVPMHADRRSLPFLSGALYAMLMRCGIEIDALPVLPTTAPIAVKQAGVLVAIVAGFSAGG